MGTNSESNSNGLRALGAGAFLCAAALIAGAGGVAIAMPSAIPDTADGEVHVCYNGKQSRNKDGGAILRIYDGDRNTKQCLPNDTSVTLPTRTKLTSGQVFLTDLYDVTTTYAAVSGLSINLPAAGTYSISADVRGVLLDGGANGLNCFMTARLASNNVAIANSHRQVVGTNDAATVNEQATAPITQVVTVTGPATITVQAQTAAACTGDTVQIQSGPGGVSSLSFVKIA